MRAAELFVRQLEEEGVEYVFGLPGEENLHLVEALRKSRIELVVTRHEQAAAFMAAAYGRLTGRAGVCLATLGPGATNLMTGVAQAQLIGAPLVAITGQKALRDNWQARFQILNVVSLMRPITKRAFQLVDPNTIPTVIRDCFRLAQAERPGAVHIELPEDVARQETAASLQRAHAQRRPAPDARALERAAKMIMAARHPLVIVSAGANRNQVTRQLMELMEKTGLYVLSTQMGKGVIDEDSPRCLFATGIHAHDWAHCAVDKADLIITIGYSIVEYPPYVWNKGLDKKIINIDFSPVEPDRYFNPEVEVVGDIAHTLGRLAGLIPARREFPEFARLRSLIRRQIFQDCRVQHPPLPQEAVRAVRSVLGPKDILSLDNGIYKLWFARLYQTHAPNTFLVDNTLATMGAGLPAAIAAKLVHPDRRVLAVCGDGGFMMNSQELETARRLGAAVVCLVLNDNAYGFIKWKQAELGCPGYGLEYGNPDFTAYAASFGLKGFKVNAPGRLGPILEEALALNEPALVECPIDYSVNYEVFSREIKEVVC